MEVSEILLFLKSKTPKQTLIKSSLRNYFKPPIVRFKVMKKYI